MNYRISVFHDDTRSRKTLFENRTAALTGWEEAVKAATDEVVDRNPNTRDWPVMKWAFGCLVFGRISIRRGDLVFKSTPFMHCRVVFDDTSVVPE